MIFTSSNNNFYKKVHSWCTHTQTCTRQGRREGKWEKVAEAWWGELPLLVRSVTWQQRRHVTGAKYSSKNEGIIYKRVEAEGKERWGGGGEGHWDGGKEGVLHYESLCLLNHSHPSLCVGCHRLMQFSCLHVFSPLFLLPFHLCPTFKVCLSPPVRTASTYRVSEVSHMSQ